MPTTRMFHERWGSCTIVDAKPCGHLGCVKIVVDGAEGTKRIVYAHELHPMGIECKDMAEMIDVSKQTESLLIERNTTHGDWPQQSQCAQELKALIHKYNRGLKPHQLEALEMDAVKTSRILCGNADEPDHWDDKAGYAMLGKGEVK